MKINRKTIIVTIVTILNVSTLTMEVNAQKTTKQPANQPVARPAYRMPVTIKSAEILPDNSVIFRLLSKDAGTIAVSGDWMPGFGSSVPMVKNDTNLWTITVGPLKPELYSYTFLIDGTRVLDPNNPQVKFDGSRNESMFLMPGLLLGVHVR